jgi:hypothetical protein
MLPMTPRMIRQFVLDTRRSVFVGHGRVLGTARQYGVPGHVNEYALRDVEHKHRVPTDNASLAVHGLPSHPLRIAS